MKNIVVTIFLFSTINTMGQYPAPVNFTADQDHKNMMEQLGVRKLRPGPSGNDTARNHANYDESVANPYPVLPDVLTTKKGKKVTTAKMWWKTRRPEIVEDMEREVYGRLPKKIPQVTWSVTILEKETVAGMPVIAKKLVGHVDNSDYPLIDVNISLVVVVPANAKGRVPVLMMLGRPALPAPLQPTAEGLEKINKALKIVQAGDTTLRAPASPFGDLEKVNNTAKKLLSNDPEIKAILDQYPGYNPIVRATGPSPFGAPPPGSDPPTTQQLLADGWGYATLDPGSIQADNGAGITRGIIGLVNKGQPRKPDDWGALRAWAWGAARALDYLETDPAVDAKHVGIEGVSRYGKAALVTLAFEQRFAMSLVGSSGKGGATLHRRNWGEAVESLTGGEYYWMAGNYIKYGESEGKLGDMNGGNLPVDSHELIAMCAPRLTFISYGVPEKGDAKWLDHQGSYMATVAAQPVFTLLGAKGIGVSADYTTEKMPAPLIGLLDGELAWRQHTGGHTDAPNGKYFIEWADKKIGHSIR